MDEQIRSYTARLTSLFVDKKDIEADIAEVKKEAKDLGLDVSAITKVANAIAAEKLEDLEDNLVAINKVIEANNN